MTGHNVLSKNAKASSYNDKETLHLSKFCKSKPRRLFYDKIKVIEEPYTLFSYNRLKSMQHLKSDDFIARFNTYTTDRFIFFIFCMTTITILFCSIIIIRYDDRMVSVAVISLNLYNISYLYIVCKKENYIYCFAWSCCMQ